jgi:branched-chain amino acid transport system substrate-binding protein
MERIRRACAAALAVGFSASPGQAEVLIGSPGPITGKMAWFGEQHQRAVELAIAEINARGGLLGETVDSCLPTISATPSRRSRPRKS